MASYGEAQIDNWFWEHNWKCVYEPQIVIDDEEFLPDWILWPQQGINKPIIVEFWGLCREDGGVAQWARLECRRPTPTDVPLGAGRAGGHVAQPGQRIEGAGLAWPRR